MQSGSFFNLLLSRAKLAAAKPAKVEPIEECDRGGVDIGSVSETEELVKKTKKKRKSFNGELSKLGVDSSVLLDFDGRRLRENRNHTVSNSEKREPMRKKSAGILSMDEGLQNKKRWVRLVKLCVD